MARFGWFHLRNRLVTAGATTWRALTAALLLAALAQPGATPVRAAPVPAPQGLCALVVSVTSDAGAGSLRDAVACAVAGDTVTFDSGLAGQTISLTTGEIELTASITIDGSGAAGVAVDAGQNSRIFFVNTSAPVTLTALSVQNGSADFGGAIYSFAGPLTLNAVAVLSSTATAAGGGGGLYSFGTVTMTGGRFEANTCTAATCVGGGLRVHGYVVVSGTAFISNTSLFYGAGADLMAGGTLTNGRFENNRCTENNCSGGGVRSAVTLTLINTDFISNTTVSSGAGVYAADTATVSGGVFERNACGPSNCNGGGLYVENTLTLTGTEFISNTSRFDGGGVYANGSVTVSGARFENNHCTANSCYGGGLTTWATLALTETEFLSNTSGYYGGGAFAYTSATVSGGRFQGNACNEEDWEDCSGGGLTTNGGLTLADTEFSGNSSQAQGGGAYADGAVTASGSLFAGNECTEDGCQGGGLITYSTLTLTDTEFISNTSRLDGGGAYADDAVTASGSLFAGNACTEATCTGGGLSTAGPLTLTDTEFISNTSQANGGAILAGAGATLNGGLVQGNTCAEAACQGGGVAATGAVGLTDTDFISNTSGGSGGGLLAPAGVALSGGRFQGNTCTETGCLGGGLFTDVALTVTGTQFIDNSSQASGGGVRAGDSVTVTNGRFERNTCAENGCEGGGLYANGALTLTGTDFITNSSRSDGGGAWATGAVTVTNGRLQGNDCTQEPCHGGALLADGTLVLSGTAVLSNTAETGGGGIWAAGATTLLGASFQANACTEADCQGGGLHGLSTLTASDTEFNGNLSTDDGAGVYAAEAVTLTDSVFAQNACDGDFCRGGGLHTLGALTLTNTDFVNNTSGGDGGGAQVEGVLTATGARFEGNACTGPNCRGGGLDAAGGLILTGTELIDNSSLGHGGAAAANNDVLITNSLFSGNACTDADEGCAGGALYLQDGLLLITNTQFLTNTSTGEGGAITSQAMLIVTGAHFQGNACTRSDCRGGAVAVSRLSHVIRQSSFSGNQAAGVGGALATRRSANLTLVNVTLSGNTAAVAGGALYTGETSQAHLVNVTVAGNVAAIGGGLYTEVLTKVGVTNTLVADNGLLNCAGQIDFGTHNREWPGGSCAVAGPSAGFSSANPLLGPLALNAPGATWTRALLENSPARDAGHAATCAGPLVNNVDQRGVTRPIDGDLVAGAVCDIGAYEAAAASGPVEPDEWFIYLPLVLR